MQIDSEKPMLLAKLVKDLASKDECNDLVNYASKLTIWDKSSHPFWDDRVINARTIANDCKPVARLMVDIRNRAKEKIKEVYQLDKEIYPDLLQMVRWPVGLSQPPHSDAYNLDGSYHPTAWRHFGSVIYLNENYSGGQTYYPNFEFEIQPVAGSLAVHPSDLLHYHGVREVVGSTRYTIVMFWTFDQNFYDGLDLNDPCLN